MGNKPPLRIIKPRRVYNHPKPDSQLQALLAGTCAGSGGLRPVSRARTLRGTGAALGGSESAGGQWGLAAGAGEMADWAPTIAADVETG